MDQGKAHCLPHTPSQLSTFLHTGRAERTHWPATTVCTHEQTRHAQTHTLACAFVCTHKQTRHARTHACTHPLTHSPHTHPQFPLTNPKCPCWPQLKQYTRSVRSWLSRSSCLHWVVCCSDTKRRKETEERCKQTLVSQLHLHLKSWHSSMLMSTTHACTHARTHARTYVRTHARAHTHTCTHTHTHTHARTHTHAHTHIHTHACTHTHTIPVYYGTVSSGWGSSAYTQTIHHQFTDNSSKPNVRRNVRSKNASMTACPKATWRAFKIKVWYVDVTLFLLFILLFLVFFPLNFVRF